MCTLVCTCPYTRTITNIYTYTHPLIRCMLLAVGLDICLSVVKMCQTGSTLPSPGQAPYNTSQTSLYLSHSLCAPSALTLPPSVFPRRCLLLSVSLTTNAAKLRVSCMLYIIFFPLRLCLCDFSHNPLVCSIFFLFCTIIPFSLPYVSCPLVPFLALPVLTSFSSYLALLSLSPSVLSTSQQSPGVKTCWHPLV